MRYSPWVIRTFICKETKKIWEGQSSRKFPINMQNTARRKLRILNNTQDVRDLRIPPGNRLEVLRHEREGQHSIRINDQYRICFVWKQGEAYQVEIVDYH